MSFSININGGTSTDDALARESERELIDDVAALVRKWRGVVNSANGSMQFHGLVDFREMALHAS